jgi:hypothetical protein
MTDFLDNISRERRGLPADQLAEFETVLKGVVDEPEILEKKTGGDSFISF